MIPTTPTNTNRSIPTVQQENAIPTANNRKTKTEWKTIKTIAKSNNFPDKVIIQLKSETKHKTRDNETNTNKNKKWAVFTYYSPRIRKITNLFKHSTQVLHSEAQTQYSNSQNQNHKTT